MRGTKNLESIRDTVSGADYIFVGQEDNWADEMDVYGYAVFTKDEFEKMLLELGDVEFPVTRWFGTNEEGEYSDVEEFLYYWEVKPISKVEYDAFLSIFGRSEAGEFYIPE